MTVGRFAPSPSGRMHLGNIFTALVSWLSARSAGGRWVLRIEDLDPQRSKLQHARMIEDDLEWLGLDWDEGGLDNKGPHGPYSQSRRDSFYADALQRLRSMGLTYPCTCTRAEIMATQAPHASDGRVVYSGHCRPADRPPFTSGTHGRHTTRIFVPDETISFSDGVYGPREFNVACECGDFILQRADGAWAYQLAVVVDDALMKVTEVVRGNDLLSSTAQQLYLYRLLGLEAPRFIHLPLICADDGRRLSKRDRSLSMEQLRRDYTAPQLTGHIARLAGLTDNDRPVSARELARQFDLRRIPAVDRITL